MVPPLDEYKRREATRPIPVIRPMSGLGKQHTTIPRQIAQSTVESDYRQPSRPSKGSQIGVWPLLEEDRPAAVSFRRTDSNSAASPSS